MALRIGIPLFTAAFVADLAKMVAVDGHAHVSFHDVPSRLPKRLLGIVLAPAVAFVLTRLSARRRRPWGADFIRTGDAIMNVADSEIFFGYCVTFGREALAR